MPNKLFNIILFALLSCGACFGQSSFQGITPGTSTRHDVENTLGPPVRTVRARLFEYKSPDGVAKVEVEYLGETDDLVARIEVYFLRPISRRALLQKFKLPDVADSWETDKDGKLVEYFAGSDLLALTYATAESSSGVSRVGYYTLTLFASAVSQKPPHTDGGILNEKAISKPDPVYPPIAKYSSNAAEREGRVTVRVLVGESGTVISASAVSGPALLRSAAVSAARQARFSPTLVNGKPVRVSGVLTYDFVLK